ncbi:MAG: protein translocase component YidC [Planctomycetes bacterium]|nr:protein translocase component YidC [Planctomycetota bacterium]
MAKPSSKSNFLQTFLLMATIFLGLQLLLPKQPDPASLKSLNQYRTDLAEANAKLNDISAVAIKSSVERAVDKEVSEKKLTQVEGDKIKLEANVLLADTQLKAGIARKDTGRIRNAYHTLQPIDARLKGKPEYANKFAVADVSSDARFGWSGWSAQGIHDKTIAEISERSKHDLIWGLIPGGYAAIDGLVHMTGAQPGFSYWFAALILAVIVRAIVFPVAQKQMMFGRQMMQLQPLAAEIKKQYEGKPEKQAEMQKSLMALYAEYGVNPAAGCLPALVQIPLFLTVYQFMLLYQFDFSKGTFAWVNPNTSQMFPHGFVAPNLGTLDPALIIIYGVMMIVSTLLTPQSDPMQAKQQRLMGVGISIFFTVSMFFGFFPVPGAFVLYWIFLLILSTLQALRAYRLPVAPLQKVNTSAGGVHPTTFSGKWQKKMQDMMEAAEQQQNNRGGGTSNSTKPGTTKPSITGGSSVGDAKTGKPVTHKPKKRK